MFDIMKTFYGRFGHLDSVMLLLSSWDSAHSFTVLLTFKLSYDVHSACLYLPPFIFSFTEQVCGTPAAQWLALPRSGGNLYEEIIDNHKSPSTPTMEAFKLQKKYPEVSRDEMFDLINHFKSVLLSGTENQF